MFSVFGFLYVKNRGKKDSIISRFVPHRKSDDRDYLRLVIDGGKATDVDSADEAATSAGSASTISAVTAKP